MNLLFETRFVQAIYSDVTAGQGYPDAWKLTEESKEKFEQKVAKEAKTHQELGSSVIIRWAPFREAVAF